jgi:soluble lytic murein transglycosylase
MRGWLVAMVLVAGAGHAYEVGGIARMLQGDTASLEVEALRRALAEREATIERLQRRIAELESDKDLRRAEELGVVKAVRASGLPDKQQRRLAVTIVREAEKNGLDPLLVVSVIRSESSFNPYAVSRVGAMGLMQVMPDTGRWLLRRRGETLGRATHLFDAELNVELGTSYLAELLARFGTVERALVAYNAGPAAAKKIFSHRAKRATFVAGYPRKVVREFQRLKAEQQAELSRRVATAGPQPTG